mmetsp:Transcript_63612/g.186062  ORF Transcript_63612/g.186062 Transcript_63612/m.186062 type:complete len:354 (-) Transcript_63612:1397-2458(-)
MATSLQSLSGPLDAFRHEVCQGVDGRVIEQQGARQVDAGELFHQLISELNHGQTVKTGVHERSVPSQRLDTHQTVRHILDLELQHLRVHLPLAAVAAVAASLVHLSDHVLHIVREPFSSLVVLLPGDAQGLVGALRRLRVLPVYDVAVRGEDQRHHLSLLVALGRAQLLGCADAGHGLLGPLAHEMHLGHPKVHRKGKLLVSVLQAELQRLLCGFQGVLRSTVRHCHLRAAEGLLDEHRELDGREQALDGGLALLVPHLLNEGQALLGGAERCRGVADKRLDLSNLIEGSSLPPLVLLLLEDELRLRGRRDRLVVLVQQPGHGAHHQQRAALGVLVPGLRQQLLRLPGGLHRL